MLHFEGCACETHFAPFRSENVHQYMGYIMNETKAHCKLQPIVKQSEARGILPSMMNKLEPNIGKQSDQVIGNCDLLETNKRFRIIRI